MGPLLSFVALFALPLVGALALPANKFAFWALLASISTIALSLDFGGTALLTAQWYFSPRAAGLWRSMLLSVVGSSVVCIVAILAWMGLASSSFQGTVGLVEGSAAILCMTSAAAIRSILMVLAQAALLEGWIGVRNLATAGHAAAAVTITFIWLFVDASFWALPMGWLVSGVVMVPGCVIWFAIRARSHPHVVRGHQALRWRQFAGLRTLNTVVASAVLQGDRWIIALIGGPAWLALYEVAWRFAALPRILVQALSLQTGAEVAPMTRDDAADLMHIVKRSTVVVIVAGTAAAGVSATAYWVFTDIAGQPADPWLFTMMVIAFTALAATSPLSYAGTAAGRPGIDLPYALAALSGLIAFAIPALLSGDTWLFVVGYLGSLIISVPIFFAYAPRVAREGIERRTSHAELASGREI